MIEYTVEVYPNGTKLWNLNNKLHREDGPAIDCADGRAYWYLNGLLISEQEHAERTSKDSEALQRVRAAKAELEAAEKALTT